ncbi:hypothetical protein NA56DRAFT_749433 [Hyaloscypha hepaticicola]|uniref:Uncharacterized protein n=1 Tax=Hyaloscypha hepaticicola TaxID=2082293 RepID=A0A2J6Q3Z7_9HELO|nr:hypothetical protein NA56DRAFT_749433 [Hyaloscypha hepaticicola]
MLNVESTREIDRLREGAIEGVEEGRKEGGKEGNGHRIAAANRTSTELHLCFIPMQSQQLYELPVIISHAWYSHGLQQSHIPLSLPVLRLKAPRPPPLPSQFPIRTPADLGEEILKGFNRSQSIDLLCTNKRHGPAASSSSITPPALTVQILANRSWASAGLETRGRLPTARNRRRFATFLAAVTPACQSPALPARHLRPLLSDWLLFSPKKKVNISMPTTMQSSWYERMPAHLSISLFIVRLRDDGKLMNHLS